MTPTHCILNPPSAETSNELLREFSDFADRFLRVQFVDDDGDFPVNGETLVIDHELQGCDGVFARVRRVLSYGIHIAGRLYVFATFSESQVRCVIPISPRSPKTNLPCREHGLWMISEDGDFTVAAILASMGDLSKERIIAKHAARQGLVSDTISKAVRSVILHLIIQKLSTTRAVDNPVQVELIQDIQRNSQFVPGTLFVCRADYANLAPSPMERVTARRLSPRRPLTC